MLTLKKQSTVDDRVMVLPLLFFAGYIISLVVLTRLVPLLTVEGITSIGSTAVTNGTAPPRTVPMPAPFAMTADTHPTGTAAQYRMVGMSMTTATGIPAMVQSDTATDTGQPISPSTPIVAPGMGANPTDTSTTVEESAGSGATNGGSVTTTSPLGGTTGTVTGTSGGSTAPSGTTGASVSTGTSPTGGTSTTVTTPVVGGNVTVAPTLPESSPSTPSSSSTPVSVSAGSNDSGNVSVSTGVTAPVVGTVTPKLGL